MSSRTVVARREKGADIVHLPGQPGGAPRVGCLVWTSGRSPHADPAALRIALLRHAPDLMKLVADPPHAHTALRRALLKVGRKTPRGYSWKELGTDTSNNLILAIAEVDSNAETREYEAKKCATVAVNADGKFTSEGNRGHDNAVDDAIDALHNAYNAERGVLGTAELWTLVKDVVAKHRAGCVVTDGVLFVSSPDAEADLHALHNAFRECKVSYNVRMLEFFQTPSAIAQVRDDVAFSLEQEIQQAKKMLEKRLAASKESGRRLRRDGMEAFMRETEEIRGRVRLAMNCLKMEATELEKSLKALEQEANEAVETAWGGSK